MILLPDNTSSHKRVSRQQLTRFLPHSCLLMQLPLCSYWLSAFQPSQKNYRKALLIVVDRRERHCLCKSLNLKDAINSAARAWSDILETTLPHNYHGIVLKKVREKGGSPPFLISSETKDHSSKGTLVSFLW